MKNPIKNIPQRVLTNLLKCYFCADPPKQQYKKYKNLGARECEGVFSSDIENLLHYIQGLENYKESVKVYPENSFLIYYNGREVERRKK